MFQHKKKKNNKLNILYNDDKNELKLKNIQFIRYWKNNK